MGFSITDLVTSSYYSPENFVTFKAQFCCIRKIQSDLVLFLCFQCHEHVTNLVRASKNLPLVLCLLPQCMLCWSPRKIFKTKSFPTHRTSPALTCGRGARTRSGLARASFRSGSEMSAPSLKLDPGEGGFGSTRYVLSCKSSQVYVKCLHFHVLGV